MKGEQKARGKRQEARAGSLTAETLTRLRNDASRVLGLLCVAYAKPGVPYVAGSVINPDAILRMVEAVDLPGFEYQITPQGGMRVVYRPAGGGE